jgi:hypothetical protein
MNTSARILAPKAKGTFLLRKGWAPCMAQVPYQSRNKAVSLGGAVYIGYRKVWS